MAEFKAHKVVSALPSTLEADTVYFVRTGAGFDLFVSDTTGNIAYAVNAATPTKAQIDALGINADTVDGLQAGQFLRSDANDTFTGGRLSFGSTTRQMIDLWGPSGQYGIGVQFSTTYCRSGGRFSWHRGGSHSNTENNPGAGGVVAMTLDANSNLSVGGTVSSNGRLITPNGSGIHMPQPTDTSSDDGTIRSQSAGAGGALFIRGNYNPATSGRLTIVLGQLDVSGDTFITGDLSVSGTISTPSDIKLKENIQPLEAGITDKLNPVSFDWKKTGKGDFGFIAQEIEEVLPSIVSDVKDGQSDETVKAYTPLQIIPFLVRDLQETRETVKAQQAQIDELRAMVEALVGRKNK